ncbi:DNA-binding transcriptional MerR regulator [Catenuloplanes nepalensis]|uniref:DNA-binding transcriptional MerR regulator n=1 Tax=Catenuloplanes nepalensis TaxID=587533 RepID=A0ABT9N1P6_9ACTN|nr:MerR family transcriptional regulator [Catenuloplanes nepalensis]MDP9797418.1 DNA-binding transcriptional MerR regulator [Catenuloplanes nepalensis]
MRVAELSRRTGVPVPTIKFYLREGVLPPGELTSPNQASYDEGHVRRLRLVRAMLEVGRLPIATIREVLREVDDKDLHGRLGRTLYPLAGVKENEPASPALAAAMTDVDALIARWGWRIDPVSPGRRRLAEVMLTFRELDVAYLMTEIDRYAQAAEMIAESDLRGIATERTADDVVTGAVIGTVVGDALQAALRRLAHEHTSPRFFGEDADAGAARNPADGESRPEPRSKRGPRPGRP